MCRFHQDLDSKDAWKAYCEYVKINPGIKQILSRMEDGYPIPRWIEDEIIATFKAGFEAGRLHHETTQPSPGVNSQQS